MRSDRPSATAITIALALLALKGGRADGELVSDEEAGLLARQLRRLGGVPSFLARGAGWRVVRPIVRLIEWSTVPGIVRHFGVRKRLIHGIVEESIAGGVERVVVLGAGLDLLTLRLAKRSPRLTLIEIDHPGTLPSKRRFLQDAGPHADRVALVGADLSSEDIGAILAGSAGAGVRSVVVAEGLTMYLTPEQVGDLLESMSRVPGVVRLVFTFLETDADGHAAFPREGPAFRVFLRRANERFKWGCGREDLPGFTERHGWCVHRILGAPEFGPGFTGEFIADCTVAPMGTLGK